MRFRHGLVSNFNNSTSGDCTRLSKHSKQIRLNSANHDAHIMRSTPTYSFLSFPILMPSLTVPSTSLTITNPLILYRTLLSTKQIDPDPAQHRLALHLQKLYHRLKDYSPQVEYGSRLKAITEVVKTKSENDNTKMEVAASGHPLRENPLFSHLFGQKGKRDALALTKSLSSYEAAMNLNSPKGLLLHGEVGTGKSMLVDLLADSLPNRKKRRWHYNSFMLETLSKLESLRQSRSMSENFETEYSLLWLAKDMIDKSPIVFLDEFQLPDRAASKILSHLFTMFFQLGGVLVASSNRMPDELVKASGVEYSPLPKTGIMKNWLGLKNGREKEGVSAGNNEFTNFLDVLKARCEVWDMDGGKDWRRREAEERHPDEIVEGMREHIVEGFSGLENTASGYLGLGYERSFRDTGNIVSVEESTAVGSGDTPPLMSTNTPKKYHLSGLDSEDEWSVTLRATFSTETPSPIPWEATTLLIYGRPVSVTRQYNGVTLWDFEDLCGGAFGPADYITMASTFHTLILDSVPILTLSKKNEARRLITLLDALYESRCKLVIRAASGPDTLFFPETTIFTSDFHSEVESESESTSSVRNPSLTIDTDAVYPETLSEIYQDQTSPFRPNISSYKSSDEDSDFGPIPGAGHEIGPQAIDFAQTGAFTGEDERFAYKRARSRLWEMCSTRWHARSGDGWWRPLPVEVRSWERPVRSRKGDAAPDQPKQRPGISGDVKLGGSVELEERAGLQGLGIRTGTQIVFTEQREPPTKIGG